MKFITFRNVQGNEPPSPTGTALQLLPSKKAITKIGDDMGGGFFTGVGTGVGIGVGLLASAGVIALLRRKRFV